MTPWLEALIDPSHLYVPILTKNEAATEPAAIALLLDARLREYGRAAANSQWPQLGAPVPSDDKSLIAALVAHLSGDSTAASRYSAVADDPTRIHDERIAAAILRSICLADAGQIDAALAALTNRVDDTIDEGRVLILLQIGVRQAEIGEWAEALRATQQAVVEWSRSKRRYSEVGRALRVVAYYNSAHFEFYARSPDRKGWHGVPVASSVHHGVANHMGGGLGQFLNRYFDGETADPERMHLEFGAQDEVEVGLFGGLLRSECIADWQLQRDFRRA